MMLGNRIDEYSQNELLRQSELITSMQGACSHYIGELFDSMAKEMDNITANQHQLDMYGSDSSISYLMSRRARQVKIKSWGGGGHTININMVWGSSFQNMINKLRPRSSKYCVQQECSENWGGLCIENRGGGLYAIHDCNNTFTVESNYDTTKVYWMFVLLIINDYYRVC